MHYYEHPDDVQSMKGLADILRGEGPHSVLVVLSMLALMKYPVACLVLRFWVFVGLACSVDCGICSWCSWKRTFTS